MKPSQSDIFIILRQSLFQKEQEYDDVSTSVDWTVIYDEMNNQAVSSLVYPWLKTHTLSDIELQNKWMTACLQEQARWIQVMHVQNQLISLMEQHNIPCVIIKGSAAMIAYPHPQYRAAGDIDFLVKRADFEKAACVLENNGYHLELDKNPSHHHYNYIKDGVILELHKRLGIIKENDEDLLTLFENGIDNRTWNSIGDYCFPTLPQDMNGYVLLFHINQHLRTGIGLRQIIDWMMYIHLNGFNNIRPFLKTIGMEKLAITITLMCQKYLGLQPILDETGDYPVDKLFEYIMRRGNLGKKNRNENRISSASLIITNPIRFFSMLQKKGLISWKAIRKYKVLKPFAWFYQLTKYISELIENRTSFSNIRKAYKDGLIELTLINELGLTLERTIEEE